MSQQYNLFEELGEFYGDVGEYPRTYVGHLMQVLDENLERFCLEHDYPVLNRFTDELYKDFTLFTNGKPLSDDYDFSVGVWAGEEHFYYEISGRGDCIKVYAGRGREDAGGEFAEEFSLLFTMYSNGSHSGNTVEYRSFLDTVPDFFASSGFDFKITLPAGRAFRITPER